MDSVKKKTALDSFFIEINKPQYDKNQKSICFNKILEVFQKEIKFEKSNNSTSEKYAYIKKTSSGSTGITCICSIGVKILLNDKQFCSAISQVSNKALQELQNDKEGTLSFVLKKHMIKNLSHNEVQGSEFVKNFLSSVPTIIQVDHKIGEMINNSISKVGINVSDYDKDNHEFLFMPQFQGMNLTQFFEDGHLNDLSEKEVQYLFESIGEICLYDLALGNSDRFFKVNLEKEGVFEPHLNAGNLMLHFARDEDNKRALTEIHFIDNASDQKLLFNEKKKEEDLDDSLDLFDDEEDLQDPISSGSNSSAVPSQGKNLDENNKKTYEELRNEFTKHLKNFNKEKFVDAILHSLNEKNMCVNVDEIGDNLKNIRKHLEDGIEKAKNKLAQNKLPSTDPKNPNDITTFANNNIESLIGIK